MKFFDTYTSNSLGAAGNQHYFVNEDPTIEMTSRVFYKVYAGGSHNYSFLFSNIVDSTYAEGQISHMNLVCDEWEMISAAVAVVSTCDMEIMPNIDELTPITFGGKRGKTVAPGEFFSSDAVLINAEKGHYVCLEMTFKGRMIPYHEESLLPIFRYIDGEWIHCRKTPLAAMVGCDREVDVRIGFIGDSITQGIGTPKNSYEHYAAVIAEILGERYSYWDIGLGYGRGHDAASDGAWLFKAKQLDVMTVCFGVNDIYRGFNADQIIDSLEKILTKLQTAGVRVIIQTIPPYDYPPHLRPIWEKVNNHIISSMADRADGFFDVVPVLAKSEDEPHMARFGGHPNSEGNRLWGEALANEVRRVAESVIEK